MNSSLQSVAKFSLSVDMLLANDDKDRYPCGIVGISCPSGLWTQTFSYIIKMNFQVSYSEALTSYSFNKFVKLWLVPNYLWTFSFKDSKIPWNIAYWFEKWL